MEDQSARAARLRSLREAAGLDTGEQHPNGAATGTAADPVLKFRNYTVKDDKITHEKTDVANPPKYEQPVAEPDVDIEGEVRITASCVNAAIPCPPAPNLHCPAGTATKRRT